MEQGLLLGRDPHVHAVTDLSDGLIIDLASLLTQRSPGAVLQHNDIPLSPAALRAPDPLHAAFYDGEDFELIFTADRHFDEVSFNSKSSVAVSEIGIVANNTGIHLQKEFGNTTPVDINGYTH